jgi:hypothetical protein
MAISASAKSENNQRNGVAMKKGNNGKIINDSENNSNEIAYRANSEKKRRNQYRKMAISEKLMKNNGNLYRLKACNRPTILKAASINMKMAKKIIDK